MKTVLGLTFLLILLFSGCRSAKEEAIIFGFIPSSNIEEVEIISDSLCQLLSKETGLTIKAFVAPDYASLIESIRTKHVQIAWFAPMSFVEAENVAALTPLLTSVRAGKPYFYSGIFVRSDSRIFSIDDLKGKIMGFSDPTSTAGRIFPEADIRKKGYVPESFFKQVTYLGGHDKVVNAVLEGIVDAGASFANDTINLDNAWHQFLKNKDDVRKFRVIHYTDPIPGDVIACLTSLQNSSPDDIKNITNKLMKISNEPLGQRLIKKLNRTDSLLPAQIEKYNAVREVARLVIIE